MATNVKQQKPVGDDRGPSEFLTDARQGDPGFAPPTMLHRFLWTPETALIAGPERLRLSSGPQNDDKNEGHMDDTVVLFHPRAASPGRLADSQRNRMTRPREPV